MSRIHLKQNISGIKKRGNAETKHFNDPKPFIEYSNAIDDI